MSIAEIEILQPNDFHHHFRDGDVLEDTVRIASESFYHVIAMPNLNPPITDIDKARAYHERISKHIPHRSNMNVLMTIYLTDFTTVEDIINAKNSGLVFGAKLYPSGATTNSQNGVSCVEKIHDTLEAMQTVGLPLLVHGEVTDKNVDIFDREQVFIDTILRPLIARFPRLKVVMEHITTKHAVEFVLSCNDNVAATITAHHLLYNRNDLFQGGICPHMYCLPILKREEHRVALVNAATSGNPKFFLGTDSAPHAIHMKESSCGCAGIFTSHAAIELCAEAFDSVSRLERLEKFSSVFGCDFYGLPYSDKTLKLKKESWTVPDMYRFGLSYVKPLRAGMKVEWKIYKNLQKFIKIYKKIIKN